MGIHEKKRVLITGGAGFIGSHLCQRFLDHRFEVVCMDNFYTGHKRNIKKFFDHNDFEWIRHDIIEKTLCEVDLILNFACPASPVHYQHNPVQTMKTSVLGTLNLLEIARELSVPLVQASTSEVYGDPQIHPQPESYWGNVNPIGIRSCYDEGKRAAETLCFDFMRQYDVDARVIRIFNTYGPQMAANDGRVVSNFICQALKGEDITIYGDGTQTRSFCYVDDLVDGIFKIATSEQEQICGPFNLGNDKEFTVTELAELVLKLTESKSQLTYKDLPGDDPKVRRPELRGTKSKFDWAPKVSLEEGVSKTIEYFKTVI